MRWMLTIVAVCTLGVTALPNTRQTTAAASDGVVYATAADAPSEIALTAADEPLTVCTDAGCYVVRSGPVRSVVRATTRVVTAPVRVVYAARQRQVFRSSERFMQRGPARRVVGKAARVVTAPIRWLRCGR